MSQASQYAIDFSRKAKEARAARDAGMEQAEESSGQNWQEEAFDHLKEYVKQAGKREFMMEQVREFAYDNGLSYPPSERAWGSIAIRAIKTKLIQRVGIGPTTNKRAHCNYASIYINPKNL